MSICYYINASLVSQNLTRLYCTVEVPSVKESGLHPEGTAVWVHQEHLWKGGDPSSQACTNKDGLISLWPCSA